MPRAFLVLQAPTLSGREPTTPAQTPRGQAQDAWALLPAAPQGPLRCRARPGGTRPTVQRAPRVVRFRDDCSHARGQNGGSGGSI